MPYESALRLSPNSLDKYVEKERLKVWAYTSTCILSGYVHRLYQQRLLDLLNGVLVEGSRADADFLPITEVTHATDGIETTVQFACINKASILFVSEVGQFRGLGGKSGYKLPPVVEKIPVVAKLQTPYYTLSGQMYCAKRQRLLDLLNTRARFLPVTNVDIVSCSGSSQWAADFVAVNKEQIIYLDEV